MSVLVKGMEMPTSCRACMFSRTDIRNVDWCVLTEKDLPCDCPIVPVPPHGRLIDASEITEHKYTTIPPHRKKYADGKPKSEEEIIAFKFGWNYAIDAIVENASTIIEAEEG